MKKDVDITDLIQQRQAAIQDANQKKERFFERASIKFKPLVDNLTKYKMQFMQVPFEHNNDFGIFSANNKSCIAITPKGVGLVDLTKDAKDNTKFIGLSMDAFNKLPEESQQGDMINLVSYMAQNLDTILDRETEDIYSFYESQLATAKENAAGWDQLTDSLA